MEPRSRQPLPGGATIGILGGGQLGRMLAMAALRLDFRLALFDPDPQAPAAALCHRHTVAGFDDAAALAEFASRCDVVTYEFENVPVAAARIIEAEAPVRPSPLALEKSQDRLVEKTFLRGEGIATAPFASVSGEADIAAALDAFGGEAILKTRRMGYDGKGQMRISAGQPLAAAAALAARQPCILEGLVAFEREISVVAARGMDGAFAAFDPARNAHEGGILRVSTVPAGVSPETARQAAAIAQRIVQALDYVGVIGVEFFVAAEGLLVNEIAPRVHNSGHWTEAACLVSQFEQHVRAVCGLPLGNPARHSDCVMENLIGGDVAKVPSLLEAGDALVHLYGKGEVRDGRKMGHFTRLSPRREP